MSLPDFQSPYCEVIPDEIVQRPALPSSAAERVPGKSRDTTSVRGIRAGATCIAPRQQGQERQTKAEVCWKMTSSPGVVSSRAGQRFRMGAGSRGREKWTRHPEDTEEDGWESRRGVVSAHQLIPSAPLLTACLNASPVTEAKPIEGGGGRLRQIARRVTLSPGVRYTAFPPSLSSYSENILGSTKITSSNAGPRFRGSKTNILAARFRRATSDMCLRTANPSPPTAPEEIVSLCCRSAPGNLATNPNPKGSGEIWHVDAGRFPALGGLHFAVHSAWPPIRHGDCAQGACSESSEPSAPGGWANPGAADVPLSAAAYTVLDLSAAALLSAPASPPGRWYFQVLAERPGWVAMSKSALSTGGGADRRRDVAGAVGGAIDPGNSQVPSQWKAACQCWRPDQPGRLDAQTGLGDLRPHCAVAGAPGMMRAGVRGATGDGPDGLETGRMGAKVRTVPSPTEKAQLTATGPAPDESIHDVL
ncbi:hypothetical protein CSOJ01_10396 [Colletotrichum sojae]|uniref:Uncharacterized protein n=1 Tax=Colletotrichum sojae TaxID=2175907 RepID=A0A8H6J078_9PEZI|nr:hypothetical protein CSOJ01_10396 [Colletotrichum sojae]